MGQTEGRNEHVAMPRSTAHNVRKSGETKRRDSGEQERKREAPNASKICRVIPD